MKIELTKQQLESVWFVCYNMLADAGFDIFIDENGDSSMTVSHRDYEMVFHPIKGMILVKK